MKVKVVSVEDKTFEKDGSKVAGVGLTFEVDGNTRNLVTWIPPVVAEVLQWKPGEEHEIEEYTKDGKTRFKTPQAGGGKKGGFNALSFAERLELDRFKEASTNCRTALMQAMALLTRPGAVQPTVDEVLIDAARIYGWLQSQASDPSPARQGSAGEAGVSSPASPPQSEDKNQTDNKAVATNGISVPAASSGVVGSAPYGEGGAGPTAATSDQRATLMELYKRPSAVKAKAEELFGYDANKVIVTDLSSAEVEALILEAS